MKRIDFYVQHLVRHNAREVVLQVGVDLEGARHRPGDRVLDGKDVVRLGVEALGPDVESVSSVDESDLDAELVRTAAYASFDQVIDTEQGTDLGRRQAAVLHGQR